MFGRWPLPGCKLCAIPVRPKVPPSAARYFFSTRTVNAGEAL